MSAAPHPVHDQSGPADVRRKIFHNLKLEDYPRAHRGLLLDKFVANFTTGEKNARQQLIQIVCGRMWRRADDPLYAAAYERWLSTWVADPAAYLAIAGAAAPLAIGHGAKGVLDGGVRLHRTYGLPVIPGSSIRGAVSAFTHATLGQTDPANWSAGKGGDQ